MKKRNCIAAVMLSVVMAVSVAIPSMPLAAVNTNTANEITVRDVSGTEAPKDDVTPSNPQEALQEAQKRVDAAEAEAAAAKAETAAVKAELEAAQKLIAELQEAPKADVTPTEPQETLQEAQKRADTAVAESAAAKELLLTVLGTPKVTLANTAYNKIKVSWEKMNGITGYIVYRSTSKKGTYTKIKTVKSADTLSYTNTGLVCGTTYYYKVKAYVNTSFGQLRTPACAAVKLKAKPAAGAIQEITAGKKKATVQLKAQSGVDGYRIYRSTSETGTFSKVKTLLSGATLKYQNTKLTSGKTYYYKARAYYSVGSTTVWGPYSPIISVKVK